MWTSFLLGYGGGFVDAKGKLMTETPEAIDAAKMYQTLLGKSGPQGVAGFNWNESQSLFVQGKAAMWLDGIGFAQPLEDPTKSRIVGKVGYGVMPPGPKQQVSAMFGDGEGISAFSARRAGVAVPAVGVEQEEPGAHAGGGRRRAGAHVGLSPTPRRWPRSRRARRGSTACWARCKIAQPGLPIIVPVTEFRDMFGIALTNMINGADAAAELKKATAEFQPVLDKSEKS